MHKVRTPMIKLKPETVVPFPLLDFEDGMPQIIRAGGRHGPTSDTLLRSQATQLLVLKVRHNHEENISALRRQAAALRADGKQMVDMLSAETEQVVNEAIKKLEAEKARIGTSAKTEKKRKRA